MAKIDATSESALASRFGVSGYPTIKVLKKGQAVDYEGSRTQEGEQSPSCRGGRGPGCPPTGGVRGVVWIVERKTRCMGWKCSLLERPG